MFGNPSSRARDRYPPKEGVSLPSRPSARSLIPRAWSCACNRAPAPFRQCGATRFVLHLNLIVEFDRKSLPVPGYRPLANTFHIAFGGNFREQEE